MPSERSRAPSLGAEVVAGGTRFAVWTTRARKVSVRLYDEAGAVVATHRLDPRGDGIFEETIPGVGAGALYKLLLDDDREVPDPYARSLPFGVHGPARVVTRRAERSEKRGALAPFERWIIYEVHVGAFTPAGTFRAAAARLPYLAELGVNAVELMPVHAFPGRRGWGYDSVAWFAPYAEYGDGDDLAFFVDEAHRLGISVILDVVYNHVGPDGNYLSSLAPEYFTSRSPTPWGDGPDFSNPMTRRLVLDNARYWLEEYGVDALRLDATHAIVDHSRIHVLRALSDDASSLVPPRILVAEDDRNDPCVVRELGMRAVWADDFHHQVRVLATGERDGYYAAYEPTVDALARAIERGWTYEGQTHSPSGKARGKPASDLPRDALVYCIQNHDQIGNRAMGTRLHHDAPLDYFLAASMLLLFLPSIPLLFMGQEWAASTPFLYFSDHEPELGARVSVGRRREFEGFAAFSDPATREAIPDPQADDTFARSKLRWDERAAAPHAAVLSLYRAMIGLRRTDAVLADPRGKMRAIALGRVLEVRRESEAGSRRLVVNFGDAAVDLAGSVLLATKPISAGTLAPSAAAVVVDDRAGA